MNANQHEIGKLNAQLATMTDGDQSTDLNTLKEWKVNKGFAINRVLVHSGEYFTAYAEQARMFDVRDALVELTSCRAARSKATSSTLRASMAMAARCMCSPFCSVWATSSRSHSPC